MKPLSLFRPFGLGLVATGAVALLTSCASGGDSILPATATDTYVLARVTVLDGDRPCVVGDCDPEFFDCAALTPVAIGTTYDIRATQASAGLALAQVAPNSPLRFTVSGTDTATLRGVAIEFQVPDPLAPSPVLTATLNPVNRNASYVDIDLTCMRVSTQNSPESRFVVADAANSPNATVTLTEFPVDGMGGVILARPDGRGGFAPASYVAGTFSFEALGYQRVGTPIFQPRVRVTGCFRVPLPYPERAVAVTPTPVGAAAGCP